ncbi:MAG: bifunctional phosphoribosyl-AMP cyclohydrolase/phosphoribosyl-ATP diphosphatase HisIE [Candidatus Bathyarchaeota archaeon]|nr:bifunctional phosphoribosyl-AMP cyclohydrolase/phosphoribosyl-ATP diphosphatase HisIE [Candidatus Bathyarchaeum tardum]WNZ28690.1 MAG: bifunctional phosphoribosyl-AMP cyclohydrolase/phosphoribosyl-ATP diphosphatase HisIE [Candidatus Bathyarchaeota archaeon]
MALKLTEDEINAFIDKIDFEKGNGLVPAIVQDASDDRLLMQAFMNKEALRLTLTSGKMHYWSRTKGRIWMKGEESKHYSIVENAFLDCDNDAILFKVQQVGVVCHTGEETCFYRPIKPEKEFTAVDSRMLERLFAIVQERIRNPSEDSYVSRLTFKGQDKALQKVGEEAIEFILAVKSGDANEVTLESADVFFHMLVVLAQNGYSLNSIFEELHKRHNKKTGVQS